jgi:hypothetical protein
METILNPFRHKLTFAFRCAIFADHVHRGTSYPILAKAFDVNEQTVSKICRSKNSRLYHSVFMEFDRLGIERMWNDYVVGNGVLSRIDSAAYEHTRVFPANKYVATGPGRYWLDNHERDTVEVNIRAYEDIKDKVDAIIGEEYRHGFYFKHPQLGWTFEGQPFADVQEALRYFEKFPPTWSK